MRILLAGDWHGNREWAETAFAAAADAGCTDVLQLGDFGLWPGREDAWLDHVDYLARRSKTHLTWIDGNHEHHDVLDEWRVEQDDNGLVAMRNHVSWATRGARWTWGGRRFGALGGAVSFDRFLRREGANWWAQEAVTQADVDRLGDGRLDVLATHAAPTTRVVPTTRLPYPEDVIRDALAVRDLIDQAVDRTRPDLIVHGHFHTRWTYRFAAHRVEGLAHDKSKSGGALAVLTTDDLQLADIPGGPAEPT
ncbi:MAG TPA: metallophosphoesterase [Acidimicrobiales bacterium]|jgi:hypothetical protein|nr:metallophosphoesterase [Acidimicrobiales bacterium]